MGLKEKTCTVCNKTLPINQFQYGKTAYARCRTCRNTLNRTYHHSEIGRAKSIARNKKRREKIKLEVLSHYTNDTFCCSKCDCKDIRCLSLDHINGDGADHRREIGKKSLDEWAKKNNFPNTLQVLCMNCQFIKASEEKERKGSKAQAKSREDYEQRYFVDIENVFSKTINELVAKTERHKYEGAEWPQGV